MANLFLPSLSADFLDANGKVSRVWSRFLIELFARIGGASATDLTAVGALLSGLRLDVNTNANDSAIDRAFVPVPQLAPDLPLDWLDMSALAELRKEIDDLKSQIDMHQTGELVKALDAIRNELAQLPDNTAALAELKKQVAAKRSVTGSRAGNVALASLLAQLSSASIITDNTTV